MSKRIPDELLRCPVCMQKMSKSMFLEKEEKYDPGVKAWSPTGYARWQCNYLICEFCGHEELVDDDTFAEEWFRL
jgi:hypothetical protein